MLVDLHSHTWPRSHDSVLNPDDLIERAKKAGLDGIVFTEHDVIWEDSDLEEIRASFFGSADDGELIAVATQMAGQLGDTGLGHALEQMAFDSGPRKAGPERRMIAAAALGALTPHAAQPAIAMGFVDDPEVQVRAQAATALAWGNALGQDAALARLMTDNSLQVRISAARAILKRRSSLPSGIDETAPTP